MKQVWRIIISLTILRDDVGLKKLVEYYNKASLEEREHADKFWNTRI